jgi:hypothetical protein
VRGFLLRHGLLIWLALGALVTLILVLAEGQP